MKSNHQTGLTYLAKVIIIVAIITMSSSVIFIVLSLGHGKTVGEESKMVLDMSCDELGVKINSLVAASERVNSASQAQMSMPYLKVYELKGCG